MIDLHSHILPQMDDGSADIRETIEMLRESARQGIDVIAATPHFYAHRENPAQFLARRAKRMELLAEYAEEFVTQQSEMRFTEGMLSGQTEKEALVLPTILPGAEVAYFNGMGGCSELLDMRIGQSNLLLVEMPFAHWSRRMVDEVCSLPGRLGIRPVLAHVNRYMDKSLFLKYQEQLEDAEVLLQCNAEVYLSFLHCGKAMNMLKKRQIHFLGSDCHNMGSRAPRLGKAVTKIEQRLGAGVLQELDVSGRRLLGIAPDGE